MRLMMMPAIFALLCPCRITLNRFASETAPMRWFTAACPWGERPGVTSCELGIALLRGAHGVRQARRAGVGGPAIVCRRLVGQRAEADDAGGENPTVDRWDGTIVSGRRSWHREGHGQGEH